MNYEDGSAPLGACGRGPIVCRPLIGVQVGKQALQSLNLGINLGQQAFYGEIVGQLRSERIGQVLW